MNRLIVAALVGLALPVLAACSGAPVESSAAPTTAGSPADINSNGDPFCDAAVQNVSVSHDIEARSGDLQALIPNVAAGGDIADMNAAGSALAAQVQQSVDFYDEVAPYVAGTDAEDDFATMRAFVHDYSLGFANVAANAGSSSAFLESMSAFTQRPEVLAALNDGPSAAGRVAAYIEERCGAVT